MIALAEKDLALKNNNSYCGDFWWFFHQCSFKVKYSGLTGSFVDSHQTENRIGHPVLRITEQYKSHSNIIANNNQNMARQNLFQEISKSEIN